MNIAVVGHGFVGQAVSFGFQNPNVNQIAIDPKYGNSIEDLRRWGNNWGPDFVFVCVPTPMGKTGKIDATIIKDVVAELLKKTSCPIIIKSTVTPNLVRKLCAEERIVYNPEFLTERAAGFDFINPPMHVLGGRDRKITKQVEELYNNYSNCKPHVPVFHVRPSEASFIKYGINSFLATKVTFFNQLYDAVVKHGNGDMNFGNIIKAIGTDPRIGYSHTNVPGFDGKRGYGGACFPKDTKAFTNFSDQLTLLKKSCKINDKYRSEYELDEREKEQNVSYGGEE